MSVRGREREGEGEMERKGVREKDGQDYEGANKMKETPACIQCPECVGIKL